MKSTLILTLTLALATPILAQEATETATATTTTATKSSTAKPSTTTTTTDAEAAETTTSADGEATSTADANAAPSAEQQEQRRYDVRAAFTELVQEYPRDLAFLLKVDPSLLENAQFMARYPDLQAFVTKHPEILRNPRYYLMEFELPGQTRSIVSEILEAFAICAGFGLATFVILWLVRTITEQRRWNRASRTQAEAHNKILDRFGSSEEVLAYIQSAAGSKFLESAPISVQTETKPAQSLGAPFTRVMWSLQVGVIVAIAALGMLLVSFRFEGENSHGLFAMGAIALSVGAGFIASAFISISMSRRLGLWNEPASSSSEQGLVR